MVVMQGVTLLRCLTLVLLSTGCGAAWNPFAASPLKRALEPRQTDEPHPTVYVPEDCLLPIGYLEQPAPPYIQRPGGVPSLDPYYFYQYCARQTGLTTCSISGYPLPCYSTATSTTTNLITIPLDITIPVTIVNTSTITQTSTVTSTTTSPVTITNTFTSPVTIATPTTITAQVTVPLTVPTTITVPTTVTAISNVTVPVTTVATVTQLNTITSIVTLVNNSTITAPGSTVTNTTTATVTSTEISTEVDVTTFTEVSITTVVITSTRSCVPTTTPPITTAPTCASCFYDPPSTVLIGWTKTNAHTSLAVFVEVLVPNNGSYSVLRTNSPSNLPPGWDTTATTTKVHTFFFSDTSSVISYPSTYGAYGSAITVDGNVPIGTAVNAPCSSVNGSVVALPSHPAIETGTLPSPDLADKIGSNYAWIEHTRYLSATQLASAFPGLALLNECKISLRDGMTIIDPSQTPVYVRTLIRSTCTTCLGTTETGTPASESGPTVTVPGPTVTGPPVTETGPGTTIPGQPVTVPGSPITLPGSPTVTVNPIAAGSTVTEIGPPITEEVPPVFIPGSLVFEGGSVVRGPPILVSGTPVVVGGSTVTAPGADVTEPAVTVPGSPSEVPGGTVIGDSPPVETIVSIDPSTGETNTVVVSSAGSTAPAGTAPTPLPGSPTVPGTPQFTGAAARTAGVEFKSWWSAAGIGALIWALLFG